jgi:hypothetical protein
MGQRERRTGESVDLLVVVSGSSDEESLRRKRRKGMGQPKEKGETRRMHEENERGCCRGRQVCERESGSVRRE